MMEFEMKDSFRSNAIGKMKYLVLVDFDFK